MKAENIMIVITKLEDIKKYLQENTIGDDESKGQIHLSNLPQFFWEDLGDVIEDLKYLRDKINL